MQRYAMLVAPSSNRVYNAAADKLAIAELDSFNQSQLCEKITNAQMTLIAGVSYLCFDCQPLTQSDLAYLSNLSFIHALFELEGVEKSLRLIPTQLTPLSKYDSDLLSILKFAGKTNELFTRLLLNVTLMASSSAKDMTTRRLRVLDPVCGRGTTLNQALMYGYDAAGMEIDANDFDVYSQFINRWLKDKRLKHKSDAVVLRKDGKIQAHRLTIQLAASKEQYKARDIQKLDMVCADTVNAREFFKTASFDLILADLPYGVKHGNSTAQLYSKSPKQLLQAALPVWAKLLRQGGAMGLAWNTHLAKKSELTELLESAGLLVHASTASDEFRHRVDKAIVRDIVVATRP